MVSEPLIVMPRAPRARAGAGDAQGRGDQRQSMRIVSCRAS